MKKRGGGRENAAKTRRNDNEKADFRWHRNSRHLTHNGENPKCRARQRWICCILKKMFSETVNWMRIGTETETVDWRDGKGKAVSNGWD